MLRLAFPPWRATPEWSPVDARAGCQGTRAACPQPLAAARLSWHPTQARISRQTSLLWRRDCEVRARQRDFGSDADLQRLIACRDTLRDSNVQLRNGLSGHGAGVEHILRDERDGAQPDGNRRARNRGSGWGGGSWRGGRIGRAETRRIDRDHISRMRRSKSRAKLRGADIHAAHRMMAATGFSPSALCAKHRNSGAEGMAIVGIGATGWRLPYRTRW